MYLINKRRFTNLVPLHCEHLLTLIDSSAGLVIVLLIGNKRVLKKMIVLIIMTRTSNTFSILIAAQLHSFFQHFRVKESQHLYTEDAIKFSWYFNVKLTFTLLLFKRSLFLEIAKLLLLTVSNTNEVV